MPAEWTPATPAGAVAGEVYRYMHVEREVSSGDAPCEAAAGSASRGSLLAAAREARRPLGRRAMLAAVAAAACLAGAVGFVNWPADPATRRARATRAPAPRAAGDPRGGGLGGAAGGVARGSPRMSAHDVANMLQAYARNGVPSDAELTSVGDRAQEVVGDMDAQDVARTLDSYAKIGKSPKKALLTALGRRAQQVVTDMDAQDVTATINAYAELGSKIKSPKGEPLVLRAEFDTH